MLPFLKPRPVAGVIISKTMSPGGEVQENDSNNEGLKAAAADLIRAVHAKDEDGVAAAFKSAWEILESTEPDEDNDEETSPEGMED